MTRPTLQPSGLVWAPMLPAHWRSSSLRWLATIYAGGTPDKENLSFWTEGTIPWLNSGSVNDWVITAPSTYITEEAFASSSTKWIPAQSVVIGLAGQGKTKGMAARLEVPATCNQSMAAIVPAAKVDYRFIHYWLISNYQSIRNLAGGDKRDGLNLQHIGGIHVPLPPVGEQRAIADYLDYETAKIDTLIIEQQRLIDMLRERRMAALDLAFLDSDQTVRLRVGHLLERRPAYGVLVPEYVDTQDAVPFVRVGDISKLDRDRPLPKIPSSQSEEYRRTELVGCEIVLGVVGKMGQAAVVPSWLSGANVARAVAVLRCSNSHAASLLCAWFSTYHFFDQATLATSGDSVQPTLGMSDLAAFSVNWPRDEAAMSRLIEKLSIETTKIDTLIAESERFIELSRERLAALITAAVTGQIDVRDQVAA